MKMNSPPEVRFWVFVYVKKADMSCCCCCCWYGRGLDGKKRNSTRRCIKKRGQPPSCERAVQWLPGFCSHSEKNKI